MNTAVATTSPDYEKRLDGDLNWALREGGMFFGGESEVQKSLRRITSRLNALGIDYAVVGGMALFLHGFRRFTEDVAILVFLSPVSILATESQSRWRFLSRAVSQRSRIQ